MAAMNTLGTFPELTPTVIEVLARYHLGLVPPAAGRRLARIFERNPPDALDRLERAAAYLHVTGDQAEELLKLAAQRGHDPAVDYLEPRERSAVQDATRSLGEY